MEEYLPVGYKNAGSDSLITMAFTGMGDVVTRDSMEWVLKDDPQPKIVTAMSIVGRLMNDIGYHKVHIVIYNIAYMIMYNSRLS